MTNIALTQSLHNLEISTPGKAFVDITPRLADWLQGDHAGDGLLTLFMRHTSASLTIQENADADVAADLMDALDGLAPRADHYRHCNEGADDMPSHIKGMITGAQVAIPVQGGRMVLGTWQGVFVIEHRTRPHNRQISLHYLGTKTA